MEIVKNSKINGILTIKEIPYDIAKKMMLENHYSKKWNTSFGKINIGIFKEGRLLGACVFGNLMNPKSYKNIGDGESGSVIELNRMWLDDELGMNSETILISSSFKIIKALYPHIRYVQSFADGRLGCGTVYKAASFRYFGYSESLFFKNIKTDEVFHKVPLENTKRPMGFLGKNRYYLDNNLEAFYVKTYKYIFQLYKKHPVKLKQEEYPLYDKGYNIVEYTHPIGLLCRLALMYHKIGDEEYFKKTLSHLKDVGYTSDNISLERNNQKNNKSYIWFKSEYILNRKNVDKLLKMER